MSRASSFRQRDVEKALAAARKQEIAASAVVVDLRAGTIRIELTPGAAPAGALDPVSAWEAKHCRGSA